jgi:hypothetical protein
MSFGFHETRLNHFLFEIAFHQAHPVLVLRKRSSRFTYQNDLLNNIVLDKEQTLLHMFNSSHGLPLIPILHKRFSNEDSFADAHCQHTTFTLTNTGEFCWSESAILLRKGK